MCYSCFVDKEKEGLPIGLDAQKNGDGINMLQNIPPEPKSSNKFVSTVIFIAALLILVFAGYKHKDKLLSLLPALPGVILQPPQTSVKVELKKFSSAEEFKGYFESSQGILGGALAGFDLGVGNLSLEKTTALETAPSTATGQSLDRVSETNVQVKGIDEPDIIKTDGKNIFLSNENPIFYKRAVDMEVSGVIPPSQAAGETKVIGAYPPTALAKKGTIDRSGKLLLFDKTLIVFENNKIYAYDITNEASPQEKWSFEFDSHNEIITSRSYKGKLYVVARTSVNGSSCTIPLQVGGSALSISCTDVYHPQFSIPADSTFTALSFDPHSGKVEKKVSFLGTAGTSVVYVSENNIYATYIFYKDFLQFYYNFYNEKGQDLISAEALGKLKTLLSLDISGQAKLTEFSVILQSYLNSLSADEQLRISNETQNRLSGYTKEFARELEQTGIVKIATSNLEITASGIVPGRALNQFSLDEYQDNLRIATTIGNNFFVTSETVNDVYILDKNLSTVGSVIDLGQGEQIYSVRFMAERGFVVTFKQTDPFYVLDLANAKKPQKTGELKIPGYSSYLHPLENNLILGVGKEEQSVKLSLFDVADSVNPKEISKYTLDEYWSEIASTHHAFLQDEQNKIFFIPGAKGGYIFSYTGGELKLTKALGDLQVTRAVYINNYLYIISGSGIKVLDEVNWETVKSLDF